MAGLPLLAWPAPAAGIVAVLAGLDRTKAPPWRTPLLHSPTAASLWGLTAWVAVSALSPGNLAGTGLAMLCGFGATLALDAVSDGELYLWPRTSSPAEWLFAYRPESLVELEGEPFVVPCGCGAIPQPWAGWRLAVLRSGMTGEKSRRSIFGWMVRRLDMLISAAGLVVLLLAVILK